VAQWQSKLDLLDIWNAVDEGKMTIQQLAKEISVRLRKLEPTQDEEILYERDDIADYFASFAEDSTATIGEFDHIMEQLYDWADTPLPCVKHNKKVCWVATNF
jgi:hypothetical protein